MYDHETFWLDLKQAQLTNQVQFKPLYNASSTVGSLRPQDWYEYVQRMGKNRTLFAEFRQRFSRFGPSTSHDFTVDEWKNQLCSMVTDWQLGQQSPECLSIMNGIDRLEQKSWWQRYFILE